MPYFQDGAILKVSSRSPKKEIVHTGIKASEIEYSISYEGKTTRVPNAIILLEVAVSTVSEAIYLSHPQKRVKKMKASRNAIMDPEGNA